MRKIGEVRNRPMFKVDRFAIEISPCWPRRDGGTSIHMATSEEYGEATDLARFLRALLVRHENQVMATAAIAKAKGE